MKFFKRCIDEDANDHQFSEAYEKQFHANLVKYFGEENAQEIQKARANYKLAQKEGAKN